VDFKATKYLAALEANGGKVAETEWSLAPMQFLCPACSTVYQAPDFHGGQSFACRMCKTRMTIPAPQRGVDFADALNRTRRRRPSGRPSVEHHPYSRHLVIIEQTGKTRKTIQLVGGLVLCMSILTCFVGAVLWQPPIVALSLVGTVVGGLSWIIGRIEA
jgi:hypothetical protein